MEAGGIYYPDVIETSGWHINEKEAWYLTDAPNCTKNIHVAEWQMPYLKFNDKFFREVTSFSDHVLILALRVLGEKFIPKSFDFSKFLDKVTNSVDVIRLITDLETAGVTFAPNFKESAERLYDNDIEDAVSEGNDVLALINGLKRNF